MLRPKVPTSELSFLSIDWSAPWLAPLRAVGEPLARAVAQGEPVHAVLNAAAGAHAIRFVPQAALPRGVAYEQFIHDSGGVPTRENLHDFFNGLIWRHFPSAKRQLNRLQARALAEQGVGSVRGPVRDACTLFDESGAVLQAPGILWDALCARDWQALFITHRAQWQRAQLTVFGHALLEQLVRPHKGITAHVLVLPCCDRLGDEPQARVPADASKNRANIDQWLCDALRFDAMRTKPFSPMPLLGIPLWSAENDDLSFYDDRAVFRPARVPAKP